MDEELDGISDILRFDIEVNNNFYHIKFFLFSTDALEIIAIRD